jgi:C-terminal processing protease CtpA/Prc
MAHRAKWMNAVAVAVAMSMPMLFAGGEDCQGHAKDASKAAHASKKCAYGTQDCLDYMATKMKTGGFVGIEMEKDEATGGLAILRVIPDSPAAASGLQPGDVLVALNGVAFKDADEEALKAAKKDWQPGQTISYSVQRNGYERNVVVTLGKMPSEVLAKFVGQHMLEHSTTEIASK